MSFKLAIYRVWRKFRHVQQWLVAQLVFLVLGTMRLLPARAAINFMDRSARRIGPWLGRHRVAMHNLRRAFPEKSEDELQTIALGMWGNMARLVAEYVFLDKIFDYDPHADKPGMIEVEGREIFERLRDEKRPRIFFTAHTGNFELLPICAASFELEVTALFRPPNNPYIAKRVLHARRTTMGHLVPSKAGAVWSLANVLSDGGNVGMLVDQHFHGGVPAQFFARTALTSPLLPRLARQFDADIYPARCIRLPNGRFRLQLQERIELPRTPKGKIDIDASAQLLNNIVEDWVREYPDQWMWFHKRWKGAAD
ncbi:MAG: lipid A biosynthesis lauroyl acyltransferase [Rhizobiaceae bacterium]